MLKFEVVIENIRRLVDWAGCKHLLYIMLILAGSGVFIKLVNFSYCCSRANLKGDIALLQNWNFEMVLKKYFFASNKTFIKNYFYIGNGTGQLTTYTCLSYVKENQLIMSVSERKGPV